MNCKASHIIGFTRFLSDYLLTDAALHVEAYFFSLSFFKSLLHSTTDISSNLIREAIVSRLISVFLIFFFFSTFIFTFHVDTPTLNKIIVFYERYLFFHLFFFFYFFLDNVKPTGGGLLWEF